MVRRGLAAGCLALIAALTASSAMDTSGLNPLHANALPGTSALRAVGSRSKQQRASATAAKLDSVLADLSRHASLARPGHLLTDYHSLSPAARFVQTSAAATPLVLVDATATGSAQALETALVNLGLQRAAVYSNDVGGWLPVTQLAAAAARTQVRSLRAAMPRKRSGPVATQGDYVQRSSVVRTDYPTITGAGITVGVLSDSFNCYAVYAEPGSGVPASGNAGYAFNGFTADYATDVSTGALPSNVNVLEEADCLDYGAPTQLPFSDEGRAMLQIVYDVAPGASLAFYTADNSEADFATGIGALATAGAKVIADDVGYYDEPFFQDGLVAEAVDAVEAQGIAYFSAAGNDGELSYYNTAPSFATLAPSGAQAGEYLLNFDTTGATTTTSLPVTIPAIPPGDFVAVVVEWDQPYVTGAPGSPGASSSIDLCVTGGTGSDSITDYDGNTTSCTGPNAVGVDPYQIMIVGNPANATGNSAQQTFNITVGLASNSGGLVTPGRIIVSVEDDGLGSTINEFATKSFTIQGHPNAAGAAAVGAAFYFDTPACGSTPATLEPFSSEGGAPILFDTSGVRQASPVVRQKPNFVGPDGVNTTFLGFTLASGGYTGSDGLLNTSTTQCQNNPGYPNFFGTSAATPHAAGIAALMLQANATATPTQIYGALSFGALPMTGSGPTPNFLSGYGFIQADAAFVVPTLTLAENSVALGSSTTLTWSTIDATSCTASGGWSGAQAANGSATVTPTAAGTTTYSLQCTNATGTVASSSVALAATSASGLSAPILTLASATAAVNSSTTITWSAPGATSCTASGSWSGTLASNGSQKITPTKIGTETFTLVCSDAAGSSPSASVTLTATAAVAVPAAPKLTLAATSLATNSTTTISWSSATGTSCTPTGNTLTQALGSWVGTLSASGSIVLVPLTTGIYTFSLTCSNSAGTSPASTVSLTVTPQLLAGSSGGGSLDLVALLGLAGLAAGRWLRLRPGREGPRGA